MSMIPSNVARLKPEVRLSQAIDQFQSVLSKEQQAAFHAARTLAVDSCPQLRDVMQVAAEIDRQARAKTGGQRCFGPRVTKALESIQQFVSIGDILIGGSQNLIACGVWSLVRLSLLTAARFSSYLDKLSSVLMVAGQSAPRYQEMAVLHPRSKILQSLGLEYLISVVSLCQQVVTVCNQSAIGQLKTFFKDLDVASYQSELLKWANAIKEQLSIEEARENSVARGMLDRFSSLEIMRWKVKRKAAILDACSTFDYQAAWRLSRKCGNATWFIHNEYYHGWRNGLDGSTLLVSGKLGAGKTVLLANILDNLFLNTKNHIIAYAFCRTDHVESQKYRTVVGCLARQILEVLQLEDFEHFGTKSQSSLNYEDIKQFFRYHVLESRSVFLVIDGIEECGYEDRIQIIEFLRYLQRCVKLKLCVSYRLTADTQIRDELRILGSDVMLQMPEGNPDIVDYIQASLESCLESGKLKLGDPAIILEISQALEAGAQGMFLWVVLQIEAICAQKTDNKIRTALHELPKDLPETFARSLARAKQSAPEYQERLLKVLVASVRPLTIDELREALSVVHYYPVWDPSNIINDVHGILASGGNLLLVDEEQSKVHFVHPSVKQFLLGDFGLNKSFPVDALLADMEMAQTVVTYLNYKVFDRQIVRSKATNFSTQQVLDNIVSSKLPSGHARSIALKILRSRRKVDFNLGRMLATADTNVTNQTDPFEFRQYARAHWISHTRMIKENAERLLYMIKGVYEQEHTDMLVRLTLPSPDPYERCRLIIVSRVWLGNQPKIVNDWIYKIPQTYEVKLPIAWAIENSHHGIFRLTIRESIRNSVHAVNYLRFVYMGLGTSAFRNLDPHICLKLFYLAALFGDHDICNQLLRLVSRSIPWAEILDGIPKTPRNGLAFALTFVQAQALNGFFRPSLKIKAKGVMALVVKDFEEQIGHIKVVILNAGEEVISLGDDEESSSEGLVRVFRLRNSATITVPPNYLAWPRPSEKGYYTCCKAHVGVLVGDTRLCACCVPQRYRQFVEQLGNLDLKEISPSFSIEKSYRRKDEVSYTTETTTAATPTLLRRRAAHSESGFNAAAEGNDARSTQAYESEYRHPNYSIPANWVLKPN